MPGATYLCGGDETCARHGKFLYYCNPCHEEWAQKNPHTVKAIQELAAGKGSLATYKKAKQLDKEGVPMPSLTMTTLEEGRIVAETRTEVAPKVRHRGKSHLEGLHTDTCERCRELAAAKIVSNIVTAESVGRDALLRPDLSGDIVVNRGLWATAIELANGDKRKIKILAHNRVLVG